MLDAAASVGGLIRSRIAESLRRVSKSGRVGSLDRSASESGLTGRELRTRELLDRAGELLLCASAAESAARALAEFGPEGMSTAEGEYKGESVRLSAATTLAELAQAMEVNHG